VSVLIDKSKWSDSSRRSSEYSGQFLNVEYYSESIGYRCKKCSLHCVFTPEEQKVAFEEDKKIIHYVPSLCPECTNNYERLKALIINYQSTWNRDREFLASNRKFVSDWLLAVKEKNSYGKRVDMSREKMLSKLLRDMPYE
jgi:hypothetical protein